MNDDLDAIMQVMEAAFDPRYGEAWTRRQVSDALVLPGTYYLLAGPDGEGPALGGANAGFTLSRGVLDEEELLLVAVHPDWRGRGVGARLMRRFMAAARDRGMTKLFLEMREGNPAETLYRELGFVPIGRRAKYYRTATDGPLDAITFTCDIGTAIG